MKINTWIFYCCLLSQPCYALSETDGSGVVIEYDCQYEVALSPSIQFAIRKYDPDFVMWTGKDYPADLCKNSAISRWESPGAVMGKFTGHYIGAVLAGHNKTHEIAIMVMRKIVDSFSAPLETVEKAQKRAAWMFYRVVEVYRVPLQSAGAEPTRHVPSFSLAHEQTWTGDINLSHDFVINRASGTALRFHWDKAKNQFIPQ